MSRSPDSVRLDCCHLDIRTVSSTTKKIAGSSPKPSSTLSQSLDSSMGADNSPVSNSPPSLPTSMDDLMVLVGRSSNSLKSGDTNTPCVGESSVR